MKITGSFCSSNRGITWYCMACSFHTSHRRETNPTEHDITSHTEVPGAAQSHVVTGLPTAHDCQQGFGHEQPHWATVIQRTGLYSSPDPKFIPNFLRITDVRFRGSQKPWAKVTQILVSNKLRGFSILHPLYEKNMVRELMLVYPLLISE